VSGFLEGMLGRLPIGWLQLVRNKARFAAALAGVAFAVLLVLMQLGFFGALIGSLRVPYDQMSADVLISASDMNTLSDGGPLPRQRMFEALSVEGVEKATPLYYGKLEWKQPDGTIRNLDVFGIDPAAETFRNPAINARLPEISLADTALIDAKTRNVPRGLFEQIASGTPYLFEAKGRTLSVIGTFEMGGGFSADGYLVVSDQTFLRMFPQRVSGAPNHILATLSPGVDLAGAVARLRATLPDYDSVVRTVPDAFAKEQSFQTTQRPVGLVFGFGIVIGVLVGMIIVYQVLSTDVADHLKEYATFKAIGYRKSFFLGIVFEEALILGLFGFLPGFAVSLGLYALVADVTGLPLSMSGTRAAAVLFGTIVMCALSGAVATRKLARANPADLF
jgi:putative ABC transport system permease protein